MNKNIKNKHKRTFTAINKTRKGKSFMDEFRYIKTSFDKNLTGNTERKRTASV